MGTRHVCLFLLFGLASITSGQNVTYKVTTIIDNPFVIRKEGTPSEFKGLIPDLLRKIEPIISAKFEIGHVRDFKFGTQDKYNNWTGMVGELVQGKADIAAASLTMTAERAKVISFSHPFTEVGLTIVMKKPNMRSWGAVKGFVTFLQPFEAGVWIAFLFACLLIPILYGVFVHFDPLEDDAESSLLRNIADAVPVIFYRLCLQGSLAPSKCTSRAARVLVAFWSLFLIILFVTWASTFAVYLMQGQRQIPTTPTHSFKQLSEQSGIQFGTVGTGSTYKYFTEAKDEVDRKIGEHLKDNPDQLVKSIEEGIKRVRTSNGQYAFIMEEISARLYVGQLPCDLMLIHHSFIRKSYAFGCASADVCRSIDVAIIKLKNDGEIRELTGKWMENDGGCDTNFYDDYLEYITSFNSKKDATGYLFQTNALSMEKVGSMFILLAIGIVVGVGLLIFDICTERRVQKAVTRRGGADKQPFHSITDDIQ